MKNVRHRLRQKISRLHRGSPVASHSDAATSSDRTALGHDGHPPCANDGDSRNSITSLVQPSPDSNTVRVEIHRGTRHIDMEANTHNDDQQRRILSPGPHVSTTLEDTEADLWSAAFQEAVDAIADDMDTAIFQGKSIERVFKELEGTEQNATQDSRFLRGVQYLRSVKVPLENFKLALDLASPLTRLEPTVTTVFGVVASVTAIAISLASADHDFAKQVEKMLQQISYIDGCDTLGRKADKKDIHRALVPVYKTIVQFHATAYDILTKKGMKLLIKMILEKDRLPEIVEEFLAHAEVLQRLVQKAIAEILLDIEEMLCDSKISNWLGSEKSKHQSDYLANLRDLRADQACIFLLSNSDFVRWYSCVGTPQLAIVGSMGCGKSVAMTYIHDELLRRSRHTIPQPKVCSCYCHDNETGKGVHILSVLILALLEQLQGLKKSFHDWYKREQAGGHINPAADMSKLGSFLQEVLEPLDRPLFILVDGFDECNRNSQRYLMDLFGAIVHSNPRVKTLIASRPEIQVLQQLTLSAKIDMTSDLQRDMLIVEHTVESRLSYLTKDVKTFSIRKLSLLAQGSAIWSKMVIELIAIRGIQAFGPMKRFLDTVPLPRHLEQVYDSLIIRYTSNDAENLSMLDTGLRLLTVARRLLSIKELAWAVTLALHQNVQRVADLQELVDPERLLRLLHPFISRVNHSDLRKRQLRLVHQSLREYVHHRCDSAFSHGRALRPSEAMMFNDRVGAMDRLEAEILNICMRYLLLEEIDQVFLFSDHQLAVDALPQDVDIFEEAKDKVDYDPYCSWETWEEEMIRYDPTERGLGEFFVYASCYWPEHYGSIGAESLPSLTCVEKLCRAGSTRLYNWIEQNRRPGCAIKPRFLFESTLYDPLSITSIYGTQAMLQYMIDESDLTRNDFLPMTTTKAAEQVLLWGDPRTLKILLASGKNNRKPEMIQVLELTVRGWSLLQPKHPGWDILSDFIDYLPDAILQEHTENLLRIATEADCLPVVQRLEVTTSLKGPEVPAL